MELSQELYETPGDRLEAFVRRSLQPQGGWKDQVQDAWHRIQQFLQDQCFEDELVQDREVRVLKVVKGGSSGKGTALNHSSDLDIVLFLSCFSSFQDQAFFREEIINFIEERLEYCSRSLAYSITVAHHRDGARAPRSLFLQVQSKKSSDVIRVDLLPAFDALGTLNPDSKPAPEIYADLIHSISYPGEFSPSFTVLQRHFVKSRPVKLKNLLQLVKFWYLKSEPEWKAASATDRLYQRPQAEGERGRRCPGEQESTGEMTDRHPNCMSMLLRLFAVKHKLLFRFYTELGKANTGFQAKKLRLQSLISRTF